MLNVAELDAFLEGILRDGGMDNLSSEEKKTMLSFMREELEGDIFAKLSPLLAEQDVQEFNAMADRGASASEIQNFLLKRIPDIGEITAQIILDFRNHYVAEAKA